MFSRSMARCREFLPCVGKSHRSACRCSRWPIVAPQPQTLQEDRVRGGSNRGHATCGDPPGFVFRQSHRALGVSHGDEKKKKKEEEESYEFAPHQGCHSLEHHQCRSWAVRSLGLRRRCGPGDPRGHTELASARSAGSSLGNARKAGLRRTVWACPPPGAPQQGRNKVARRRGLLIPLQRRVPYFLSLS